MNDLSGLERDQLIADNRALKGSCNTLGAELKKSAKECRRLERENKKLIAEKDELLAVLKGMTSMYGYCWDLVEGGLICSESNVQRFEEANAAAQKVLLAMSKEP